MNKKLLLAQTAEEYFWQFVENFKSQRNSNYRNSNYVAIASALSPKYSANKKAL